VGEGISEVPRLASEEKLVGVCVWTSGVVVCSFIRVDSPVMVGSLVSVKVKVGWKVCGGWVIVTETGLEVSVISEVKLQVSVSKVRVNDVHGTHASWSRSRHIDRVGVAVIHGTANHKSSSGI
jgi:hypothetical protein